VALLNLVWSKLSVTLERMTGNNGRLRGSGCRKLHFADFDVGTWASYQKLKKNQNSRHIEFYSVYIYNIKYK
jgi:hypothetical protein